MYASVRFTIPEGETTYKPVGSEIDKLARGKGRVCHPGPRDK